MVVYNIDDYTCKCSYVAIYMFMYICTCVTGSVRRRCILDGLWEEFVECFREETRMLFDQVIFNFEFVVTYVI